MNLHGPCIRPLVGRPGRLALVAAALAGLAGAGSLVAVAPPTAGAATAAAPVNPDQWGTTWLCRPGLANDPCDGSLSAVSVAADGTRTTQSITAATHSPFDCFYIYPTVTAKAKTDNTGLKITGVESAAAVAEAAQFSQVCNVWAPVYRQRTAASLAKGLGNDPTADTISFNSLLAGWKDYLAHDNDGRPVILIGHSQGAANVIRLLKTQFDDNASLRKRLISAIVAGGNVQVPQGKTVGGVFKHIAACTSDTDTGCVIAYSSFSVPPPKDSLFGRPGQGVSLQSDQRATAGQQVLCTNPADLSGGTAALKPYFPSAGSTPASTPWVTYPGLYTATCKSQGGSTWLQVTARPGDPRPEVKAALGPTWGLHADDINLSLGNLVADVHAQEAAYQAHHGG